MTNASMNDTSKSRKPPNAGAGRVKGVPNKVTALLKDAILQATGLAASAASAIRRPGHSGGQAVLGGRNAMRAVLANPGLGQKNLRPEILDQASRLMAARVLSLPEAMNELGKVSDDPIAQRSFVAGVYNSARNAAAAVIDHHGAAVAAGKLPRDGGEKYDLARHDDHIAGLLAHYPKPRA